VSVEEIGWRVEILAVALKFASSQEQGKAQHGNKNHKQHPIEV
jgi:hypothetical protein